MPMYHNSGKPPSETWFAMAWFEGYIVRFNALCLETGEVTDSLEIFLHPGALIIFPDMTNALIALALDIARFGSFTLYGLNMSAGYLHIGKRGARVAGLQGYDLSIGNLNDMRDFWIALTEICLGAGTMTKPTPGATAIEIAQALSPIQFTSPGKRIRNWVQFSYSGGARHETPGEYPQAFLYDMHAAYPFSMRERLPFGSWQYTGRDSEFYIARVVLDYDSYHPFSPLWVKGEDKKTYHPVEARNLVGLYTSDDLATFEKHGRLRIKQETGRFAFQQKPLLAPAQEYLAGCQKEYPQYRRQIKKLRNAMYGKLVQPSDPMKKYALKKIDNIAEAVSTLRLDREYNRLNDDGSITRFGLFEYVEGGQETFSSSPVASAITARLRAKVYDALDENSIAVRTDSILSTTERPDLDLGDEDGQWSIVDKGRTVVFGHAGFIINKHSHLDGVESVTEDSGSFSGLVRSSDTKAFGLKRKITKAPIPLEMEKPEKTKARDTHIDIYHSPKANTVEAKVPPLYKIKDP